MQNSTAPSWSQLTGVPMSSTRRHPEGVLQPDLNGRPDLLSLNRDQRECGELEVVGMHEIEARLPHGVVERASEEAFGQGVGPDHASRRVHDDHEVGEVRQQSTELRVRDGPPTAPPDHVVLPATAGRRSTVSVISAGSGPRLSERTNALPGAARIRQMPGRRREPLLGLRGGDHRRRGPRPMARTRWLTWRFPSR